MSRTNKSFAFCGDRCQWHVRCAFDACFGVVTGQTARRSERLRLGNQRGEIQNPDSKWLYQALGTGGRAKNKNNEQAMLQSAFTGTPMSHDTLWAPKSELRW